jgi:predicted permease
VIVVIITLAAAALCFISYRLFRDMKRTTWRAVFVGTFCGFCALAVIAGVLNLAGCAPTVSFIDEQP